MLTMDYMHSILIFCIAPWQGSQSNLTLKYWNCDGGAQTLPDNTLRLPDNAEYKSTCPCPYLTMLTVCFTIPIFPCCWVCRWTFSKSSGCGQHAAPALPRPPKYHRARCFFSLFSLILKEDPRAWKQISVLTTSAERCANTDILFLPFSCLASSAKQVG